jgi:hypothetical protein
MYVGQDFDPAEQDEDEPFAFDFGTELAGAESVASAAWSCTAKNGIDGSPATRLLGPATINGTIVSVQFGGAMPGELYVLHCEVTSSLGNRRALWSHVAGIVAS